MYKAKVTSKGQITLPVEVRNALLLETGARIVFFPRANGDFVVRKVVPLSDLAGSLAGLVAPRTDEEMNQLLADYAVEMDDATKSQAEKGAGQEAA
jgi:bifunctional DNA-binding transcriptional regulator/antitoxin component of YhaV-PrlF toxin-antitoxin module